MSKTVSSSEPAPVDAERVLLAIKTPMLPTATSAFLPGALTLAQALTAFRKMQPKDENARRVLQQLERETSASAYDFVVVTAAGEAEKASPSKLLREIAAPREIRTARGLEVIPVAAVEVQAYAPVGF
jgi:hypothetical protein